MSDCDYSSRELPDLLWRGLPLKKHMWVIDRGDHLQCRIEASTMGGLAKLDASRCFEPGIYVAGEQRRIALWVGLVWWASLCCGLCPGGAKGAADSAIKQKSAADMRS